MCLRWRFVELTGAVAFSLGLGLLGSARPVRVAAPPPAEVVELVQKAEHDFTAGNYLIAVKTLQSALVQSPSSAEACYWLARSYYELRDFDNAVVQAEKAVALETKNSLYHQWLGRAYGGKADRDRSFFLAKRVKKEFQEAIRLDPSNLAARMDLEEFCIRAPWIVGGSKEEAHSQVEAIAALDAIEGHVARGKFEVEATKRPDLADVEFQQILVSKPNRMEPYLEVIVFLETQNKLPEMAAAVEAAGQLNTNDPRVQYFRAVCWVLSRTEPAQAEEYLKSYLASTPERSDWPSHAAAREWLGRLYESQGKRAEAAEQYRTSLQLEPGRKEAIGRLQKLEKASP